MDKEPDKMQEGNEFQQVLKKYQEMLERKVSYFFDVEEYEEIIDYYLDVRDFKLAQEAVSLALIQHPGTYDLFIKLVHIHLESGKPVQAMEVLNMLPEYEKDNAEFFLLKGTALAQLGKVREAEKTFDEALSKSEDDEAETLINISIAFENARQYRLAVKYLRMAYEKDPSNITVLYDLGYYYERLHNYHPSIKFYNRYLDIDPFSENVWYNLGVVYYKINKIDKAIEAYDYAIAVNPTYPSAYFNKANIYANNKEYVKAIKVYNDFLELEPENVQGWCYLGECYEETGYYLKALEIYKKVITIDNSWPDGWYGAGIALMYLEKYREAVTYLLKAIEFEKDNSEYWFTLAENYEKDGRIRDARKSYEQVTMLDHDDREAWIRLAYIYINEKEYDKALVVLRDAYQHNFTSQDIIYMLAAVYFKTNDRTAGLRFLEKAAENGEGGLNNFFDIYPEGESDSQVRKIINKDQKSE